MAAAFHWDSFFSGLVLSSFWAGYALTQILGGKLADKYGGIRPYIVAYHGHLINEFFLYCIIILAD